MLGFDVSTELVCAGVVVGLFGIAAVATILILALRAYREWRRVMRPTPKERDG